MTTVATGLLTSRPTDREVTKRPAMLVGTGVRVAGAVDVFERVTRKLGIPVTTAWTAHDLIDSEDPLYCGRPGTVATGA